MCELMENLEWSLSWSSTFLGLFIAGVNFVFRTLLIGSAHLLKPSTFSEEMKLMKRVIFFVSFLNGGILIILMSAYYDKGPVSYLLRGQYADFTPEWFDDIGKIISTNLITTALYPFIEIIIYKTVQTIQIMKDQK